jgi:transposase
MTHKLFEAALGIAAPWYVAGTDFNAQARTLTIPVDLKAGRRFAVPGAAGEHPVHDTVSKRYPVAKRFVERFQNLQRARTGSQRAW